MNIGLIIVGIAIIVYSVFVDYDRIPGSYTKHWPQEVKLAVHWFDLIIGIGLIILGIYLHFIKNFK
jgi:uncharacterized membrane protein